MSLKKVLNHFKAKMSNHEEIIKCDYMIIKIDENYKNKDIMECK